jgi:branched-chain amino acid transport system permease protein
VAGGLAANHGMDFFVSLLAAGAVGAIVAILIGLPALRVQGMFLAVVTLAFAAAVQNFVLKPQYFSWLLPHESSRVERPLLYKRIDVQGDVAFYYVCLAVLVLAYLSCRSLRASRSGRSFIAVRDNVRAAQSYGLNAAGSRLAAFAVSGFIAAVAGALLAYQQGSVDRDAFSILASIDVFVFTVIGGLTSLPGALLGALYYEGLKYFGPTTFHLRNLDVLATGVGVLVLLLMLPGGLAEGAYRLRDAFLRDLARRRGILVPSLVADRRVDVMPEPAETGILAHADDLVEAGTPGGAGA